MRLLSKTFRSVKSRNLSQSKSLSSSSTSASMASPAKSRSSNSRSRSWCVYLIISTNTPIKTYVGANPDRLRCRIMRLLSKTFRSVKTRNLSQSKSLPSSSTSASIASPAKSRSSNSRSRSWCVYLIISTNTPIKTYVGVTTNFSRRLKQHNGELKGGAKASRAGRPWICACLIQGFNDQSEACEFESKWKSMSRKLPRKRKNDETMKQGADGSHPLLLHRHTALNRIKGSFDCSRLDIDWKLDPF